MQTTLRIDDTIHREAKAEAARAGMTLTRFIEVALSQQVGKAKESTLSQKPSLGSTAQTGIAERNRLMEALLQRTAHFRVGSKPSREEMHAR